MAAAERATVANYTISDSYEVDTKDHEDHTFSGVMFTVMCRDELPVDFIELYSISVRGDLGPLTVWWTPETWQGKRDDQSQWKKIYEKFHRPSSQTFVKLTFAEPLIIPRGQQIGMYVHSSQPGDEAIVYDNQRGSGVKKDKFMSLGPGLAHLCDEPFFPYHPWGAWYTPSPHPPTPLIPNPPPVSTPGPLPLASLSPSIPELPVRNAKCTRLTPCASCSSLP